MSNSTINDGPYLEQQNRFRGLVAALKSRGFIKNRTVSPSPIFRYGLRALLLDARVALRPGQFDAFLSWINHQSDAQVINVSQRDVGYDELQGIFTDAPIARLEQELLWITARIKADATRLNEFRNAAEKVEKLVFGNRIESAIEVLKQIDGTFGTTMWSVQLRIALEHHAGGLERQKRHTAEVRGVHKQGLLGFIAYYTSVRNEDRTTLAKFREDIGARLEKHRLYEPFVKTYVRYRLTGEWPVSESGFADILRVEQSHSFLDVYETFVATAQQIVRRDDLIEARGILARCLRVLGAVADYRLSKAALLLDSGAAINALPARLTSVSDQLLSGDVMSAAQAARRESKSSDYVDPWQFVYAGFVFAHTTRMRTSELRRPRDIPRLIARILNRHDSSGDAFVRLGKAVTNLGGLPAAAGLADMLPLLGRDRPDDPWRPWLIGMNSPTFGIEDLVPDAANVAWTAASLDKIFGTGMAATGWKCLHGIVRRPLDENHGAALDLFTGIHLLGKKDYAQAIELLERFRSPATREPIRGMAVFVLLHAYHSSGLRQKVIDLIADESIRSDGARRLIPVSPTLDQYAWADYSPLSTTLTPCIALYLLWSANEGSGTASLLRFATASFIRTSGVGLPSKLIECAPVFPRHQIIFFLRCVCIPTILDVSRVLKSSRDVLEERQAICAVLRELDFFNAQTYQDEVAVIANQLAMDEGQRIVDSTRIYVDTDALKRWSLKELAEHYARFQDLLGVQIGTTQNFDDVLKELAAAAPVRSAFKAENEADAVLVDILRRVGDEFLHNPRFGFDYFLSKRIRHQSFIGKIRGPLEFRNLITTRESASGNYHANEYWLDRFASCNTQIARDALRDAFVKFAANFDDTLNSAKDKSFHLNSSDHPGGLLYMEITNPIIMVARAIVKMDATLPDFINTIVAVLWAALEPSLAKTRSFIAHELKTRLASGFDELRATLRKYAEHDPAFVEFNVAVAGASAEVQRALDDVAMWFTHADLEATKRLFMLEQIVNISIDSVLKCQRGFDPDIRREVVGDMPMQASSLMFVHDVMFIALDNVRSHSGIKKPTVEVLVAASEEDGTLTIEIQNDIRLPSRAKQEEDLRRIRELIESRNIAHHTRREGKSGFLKLAAQVQQSSKGLIDFGFTDEGRFFLKVVYSMVIQTVDQQEVT